jgi:nucleoside-diphosphate-sugar epimerase
VNVLITGAAGLIGGVLRAGLGDAHTLKCLDIRRSRGIERVDTTNLEALERHCRGVDVIVDLAAIPSPRAPWNTVMPKNLTAIATALEAARRQGVGRVVFASSNHVTGLYEAEEPYSSIVAGNYAGLDPAEIPLIGPDWPIHPDGPYGLSKAFGESMCRIYSERFGLSTICLRPGSVIRSDRPGRPREFATFLSQRDLVRLVAGAIAAPPELRHGVYYGVSANTWRFWEIAGASEAIGFVPLDDAERFRTTQDAPGRSP